MIRRFFLRLLHEHGADAIIVSIVVLVIVTTEAVRRSTANVGVALDGAKASIDVAGKLLAIALGLIGAIATYRRFFKGRIMQPRARLKLTGRPILWQSVQQNGLGRVRALLHTVDVEIENVGAAIIWEPDIRVRVRAIDDDQPVNLDIGEDGIEGPVGRGSLSGVGPGETTVSQYRFHVPAGVRVFRVGVEVSSGRHVWHRSATLANQITPSDKAD